MLLFYHLLASHLALPSLRGELARVARLRGVNLTAYFPSQSPSVTALLRMAPTVLIPYTRGEPSYNLISLIEKNYSKNLLTSNPR